MNLRHLGSSHCLGFNLGILSLFDVVGEMYYELTIADPLPLVGVVVVLYAAGYFCCRKSETYGF